MVKKYQFQLQPFHAKPSSLGYQGQKFQRKNQTDYLFLQNTKSVFTDQTVTINVIDTNDKVPEFPGRSPATNWLDLQLPENDYSNVPAPGFFVGKIIASDADGTSPNNKVIV